MKLTKPDADLFIPDRAEEDAALRRVTHVGIGAHQDDLEIMAVHGILECFDSDTDWFLGITVTDGSGSARSGPYASTTNEEMMKIRRAEQRKAAVVGEFAAMAQLCYTSGEVKDPKNTGIAAEIKALVERTKAKVVYTHNLADKHDTHIGVVLKVIAALRQLPQASRPAKLYGCEVWRNLDWMLDEEKVALDVSRHENLSASLVALFDSQVAGGKRYDLATLGRWRANATYFASHATDQSTGLAYAMDLSPLLQDDSLSPAAFVKGPVDRFAADVAARVAKHS